MGTPHVWVFDFSMFINSPGTIVFANDINLTHQGQVWINTGASLQFGHPTTTSRLGSYAYNWIYGHWQVFGTLKVYGAQLRMLSVYNGGQGGETGHSNGSLNWGSSSKFLCNYGLFGTRFPGELNANTKGSITNTLLRYHSGMMASSNLFWDNVTIGTSPYAMYAYYGGAFMGSRNLTYNALTIVSVLFHKNNTVGVMHACNITLPDAYDNPVTANYISNRENFSVYRKFEFTIKVIDVDGEDIAGALVSLRNKNDVEVYKLTTASDGISEFARGTATSGSTTTVVDSGANWTVNELQYHVVDITGGTGSGQGAWIASNTSDTITIYGEFETAIANGSEYLVTPQPIKETYTCDPSPAEMVITGYNPFTLTISKKGYETYKTEFNLLEKVDWIIKLKHSPYI